MKPILVIEGEVIGGAGVGKSQLGYPTINIGGQYDLEFGVYVCLVKTVDDIYKGALHYGPRKTMGHDDAVLEVHLLDFDGDLKGDTVRIDVYNKLRDTKTFESAEELKQQIARDVEEVRQSKLI